MPLPRIRFRPRALVAALALLLLAAAGSAAAVDGPSAPDGGARLRPHVFPALLPDSVENTSVIAQNDGDAPSVMVMDFHTPLGVLITAASQVFTDVPPGASRTFAHALNGGLVPGFRGVGVLSSDQPMNALLARELTGPDGRRSWSLHTASARGGTRVVLPYVANRLEDVAPGDKVNTRLAIANAGERTACVRLTYAFVPDRGRLGPEGRSVRPDPGPRSRDCPRKGYPIPPNGQITFAPTRVDGALPMPAVARNTLAAVTIDSTELVTVAADVYHRDGLRLAAYDGFLVGAPGSETDDVSTRMMLPLALKTTDGLWTEYALANPGSQDTTARITYTGTAGESGAPVSVTAEVEVPAGAARGHNVFDVADLPASFRGAATIESSQPLAVVLLRGKMTEAGSFEHESPWAAANGVPAERASRTAKLPLVARDAGGGGLSTSVSVAVVGGGTANLTITTTNDPSADCDGESTVYTAVVTVTGTAIFDQGADDPRRNGLNAVPACLRGSMTIASDRDIVVVARVTSDLGEGDNDALYNAFR